MLPSALSNDYSFVAGTLHFYLFIYYFYTLDLPHRLQITALTHKKIKHILFFTSLLTCHLLFVLVSTASTALLYRNKEVSFSFSFFFLVLNLNSNFNLMDDSFPLGTSFGDTWGGSVILHVALEKLTCSNGGHEREFPSKNRTSHNGGQHP